MAKIVYVPHCARCGALIDEEVAYSYITIKDKKLGNLYLNHTEITPYSCKNCGEVFDGIKIIKPKRIESKDEWI